MRYAAVITVLAFGCATSRPPENVGFTPGPPPPVRVALAEPQLELWMEGTRPVDPEESARALEASRDALWQALDGRGLEASDPDQLLVVRARAVARTSERRSAQVWSVVGIVFVVVAIVVVAVVLSRSGSSPRAGHGHPVAVAPGRAGGLRPGHHLPRYYPPPPVGLAVGLSVAVPVGPEPQPEAWAPPMDDILASRGWFDGDEVELILELADPKTGAVSWHRVVRERIDPRDAGALSALVDRTLAGQTFGQRAPATAPSGQPGSQ